MKSARLSVYLSELGPLIRKRVLLPPFGSKRGDTLACGGGRGGTQFQRRERHSGTLCILETFICVTLEIYGIPYMKKSRNSVKFRGISRNYPTRNSAEFRRNYSQFRTEYGIDGSKKNRRNSVSTEFRGHPNGH